MSTRNISTLNAYKKTNSTSSLLRSTPKMWAESDVSANDLARGRFWSNWSMNLRNKCRRWKEGRLRICWRDTTRAEKNTIESRFSRNYTLSSDCSLHVNTYHPLSTTIFITYYHPLSSTNTYGMSTMNATWILPTYKHNRSTRTIRPLLLWLVLVHIQFELPTFRPTTFLHPRCLLITISTFSASIFPLFIFYSTLCVNPSKTLFTLLPTLALVAIKGIYFLGEPLGGAAMSDLLPTIII